MGAIAGKVNRVRLQDRSPIDPCRTSVGRDDDKAYRTDAASPWPLVAGSLDKLVGTAWTEDRGEKRARVEAVVRCGR